jgi:transcriptional regulator with XRE-family HTH domain
MSEKQIYDPRYRELVAHLKATRKKLGLTQAEVASKLGLCRTWVGKIECCELGLDLLHFIRICEVYGVRAGEVVRRI